MFFSFLFKNLVGSDLSMSHPFFLGCFWISLFKVARVLTSLSSDMLSRITRDEMYFYGSMYFIKTGSKMNFTRFLGFIMSKSDLLEFMLLYWSKILIKKKIRLKVHRILIYNLLYRYWVSSPKCTIFAFLAVLLIVYIPVRKSKFFLSLIFKCYITFL